MHSRNFGIDIPPCPVHVTKDIIFIDSMAVEEQYRGKGIGHAFFDFLKKLKEEKAMMLLNCR